ncbi:methionyl-tRNA formyltransferase [Hydrogenobacter thermophilus TK-6]|uniref:Methionyl-tRNA formyltransferase n=1 Tax=Hydrogenobacter thermophilus (strain DSM 6534 / IAM 12695 / TK-6) TaxID=608538 RepID=D3DHY7_HYDTT|nr:methionyl-tRNA formyltransferase [Hydrogenobacter thermophilus]ADO45372.1 methionyl-tRNA formyltransferase [Hydrogenobacter thermophilus TK-6]BAI69439.1 methionyl-tRNA formyltransferase [Hydrogenobacter thermophilus TK-6]
MKIVFMGTSSFAVPSLKALVENFQVVGVITQPDRPAHRGQKLTPSPVKKMALELGLCLYQPEKKSQIEETVLKLKPDCVVVVAYGRILTKEVLGIPPYGCINLHASLLPKYRGAAPIQRCLMAGEKLTGNTVMLMDEGMDTGDILRQESVPIDEEDNLLSLSEKLSTKGAKLLVSTLKDWFEGKIAPTPQDHQQATYAPPIWKEEYRICWKASAQSVKDRVRGLYPNCYAFLEEGERIKVLKVRVCQESGEPGELIHQRKFQVACGENSVEVLELINPKGKRVSGEDFLRGYQVKKLR